MKEEYRIVLSRMTSVDIVKSQKWEKLISALVMCGYNVYIDLDENIVFSLGYDDKIEKIEKIEK